MVTNVNAGLTLVFDNNDYKRIEAIVEAELTRRAIDQQVATSAAGIKVRDILPNTDFSWDTERWRYDLGSGTVDDYNQVVANVDLDKKKLVAFWGIKKPASSEDIIPTIKFKRGEAKTIDVWQLDALDPGDVAIVKDSETTVIYDSNDKVNIYFYLSSTGVAKPVLLGKVAEKRDTTVSGGDTRWQ